MAKPKSKTRRSAAYDIDVGLPTPSQVQEVWPVKDAYNAVRVVLTLRNDIRHYYSGLEVLDIEVGIWNHVVDSARPHTDRYNAEERVHRLLKGDWKRHVNPETTQPRRGKRVQVSDL